MVEIDNKLIVSTIGAPALGRTNLHRIEGESAGPKLADLASVLESCKGIGCKVREYLLGVLPELSRGEVPPHLYGRRSVEELTHPDWRVAPLVPPLNLSTRRPACDVGWLSVAGLFGGKQPYYPLRVLDSGDHPGGGARPNTFFLADF